MKNIRQIALTSYYPYGKNKDKIIAKRIFDVDEALAEHDKQIIDEFFNKIKKYCKTSSCIGCRFCDDETCEIAVIKEQLKE